MLQQTRVETVLKHHERFLVRFPDVETLAAAGRDAVLESWSGLGYYRRARLLHAAAQAIVSRGGFPATHADLLELPGVGPYMAGALGSIVLGLDLPAIDGNLERVLSRVLRTHATRPALTKLAQEMLPPGQAGDWNQALMDLGSGTCKPRNPKCGACPIVAHCAAHAAGDVEAFPAPKAKRVVPQRVRVVGVAEKAGKLLLVRRPDEGLFSGLYDLPSAWVEGEVSPEAALNAAWGPLRLGREIGQVDHVLTHMKIHQRVFQLIDFQCEIEAPTAWVDPASPAGVGLSTLTRKSLALLVENPG